MVFSYSVQLFLCCGMLILSSELESRMIHPSLRDGIAGLNDPVEVIRLAKRHNAGEVLKDIGTSIVDAPFGFYKYFEKIFSNPWYMLFG